MSKASDELVVHMKKKGRVRVADAARAAMISEASLRDWIHVGKVDAVMYAHNWWVLESSLRKAIGPAVS